MTYDKTYHCLQCGTKWHDTHDCLCDDRCPGCNSACSVLDSVELPQPKDDDVCPKAEDGKHVPDWDTLHVEFDGEAYVDVSCGLCGRSGCVGSSQTLADNISW